MTATKKKPSKEEARRRALEDDAITLADLAALMNLSPATVQRQAAKGTLPVKTLRVGTRWIVVAASVREALNLSPAKAGS